MNLNIYVGRPTADPQIFESAEKENSKTARFTIAVDKEYKREGGETADFIPCVAFGKRASFVEKYVKKGCILSISGRMENNNYTNKEGKDIYSFHVVIEKCKPIQWPTKELKENAGGDFMELPDGQELPFK